MWSGRTALFTILLISKLIVPDSAHADAVKECDLAASGPVSGFAPAEPIAFAALVKTADKAIAVCREALAQDANLPRILYQLARALIAANAQSEEAVDLFIQSAEAGYAPALNTVGVIHDHGITGVFDDDMARKYFALSAEQSYPPAMTNLIALDETGATQNRDFTTTFQFLNKAAQLGDPAAMKQLGLLYGMAHGIPVDIEMSEKWLRAAAKAGDVDADAKLMDMFGSSGKYVEFQKKAIAGGHRITTIYDVLYKPGPASRKIILDAVRSPSWIKRFENGYLYSRTLADDTDAEVYWVLMYSMRGSTGWSEKDFDEFFLPLKRKLNCETGKLFIRGASILDCYRD